MIAASATLMAVLYQPGRDPSRVYYGTDTRAQSLLIGAVLGIVLFMHGPLRTRAARIAIRVAAVVGSRLHALVVLAHVGAHRRALPGRLPVRRAGRVGGHRVGRAARPRRARTVPLAGPAALGGSHLVRPLPLALARVPDPHADAHGTRRVLAARGAGGRERRPWPHCRSTRWSGRSAPERSGCRSPRSCAIAVVTALVVAVFATTMGGNDSVAADTERALRANAPPPKSAPRHDHTPLPTPRPAPP